MAALRILLFGDAAHPNVEQWCGSLVAAGADVALASLRGHANSATENHRLPSPPVGKLRYLFALPYARSLARRLEPDLVASYQVSGYGWLAAMAGRRPIVQVTTGSDVLRIAGRPVIRRIVFRNLRDADLVTAWAPHMQRATVAAGAYADKTFVCPRGIPATEFRAHRCEPPRINQTVRIISTRAFRDPYRLDIVVEALAILRNLGERIELTLAGDGPARRKLQALIHRLGVTEAVRMPGHIPNRELARVLAEHHLYVSVIPSDGVSASLLEAMAVGLTPIVYDNEANRYWVKHRHNAVLGRLDDSHSLAAAIRHANRDFSTRLRARSENPRIVESRANSDINGRLFLGEFESLVANHSARFDAAQGD